MPRKKDITKKLQRRLQEKARALFVCLPYRIRNKEDVAKLFTGDFKINMPRQTCKHCYVIFANEEEKMKNLEAVKGTKINGKRVIIAPANTSFQKDSKVPRKKLKIPEIKDDSRVTKTLFVSNIKCGTKIQELKEAFPGCVSVKLLEPYTQHSRSAIVKMESIQIAAEYLSKAREWPKVGGRELRLNADTRNKHKTTKSKTTLKIYTGDPEEEERLNKRTKNDTSKDKVEV